MEPLLLVIHVHVVILHRHVSVTPVTFIRVSDKDSTVSTQTTVSGSCVCLYILYVCLYHTLMMAPSHVKAGTGYGWALRG